MDDKRQIVFLVELHAGLRRLGPGNAEATLRALARCPTLPDTPTILDIGCGTGAQTLVLAAATRGQVTALDRFGVFLAQLAAAAQAQGLASRIQICQGDMNKLPFPDASFDLLWSEGAIYGMGFDKGLAEWRRLVRPGGYLVVSELSWFAPDPAADLKAFWSDQYPAMRDVAANLAAARALGWQPVDHFPLPPSAWTEDYYDPLRRRLPAFRAAHAGDPDARAVADMTEAEMALIARYPDDCGYEFYILRRAAAAS